MMPRSRDFVFLYVQDTRSKTELFLGDVDVQSSLKRSYRFTEEEIVKHLSRFDSKLLTMCENSTRTIRRGKHTVNDRLKLSQCQISRDTLSRSAKFLYGLSQLHALDHGNLGRT